MLFVFLYYMLKSCFGIPILAISIFLMPASKVWAELPNSFIDLLDGSIQPRLSEAYKETRSKLEVAGQIDTTGRLKLSPETKLALRLSDIKSTAIFPTQEWMQSNGFYSNERIDQLIASAEKYVWSMSVFGRGHDVLVVGPFSQQKLYELYVGYLKAIRLRYQPLTPYLALSNYAEGTLEFIKEIEITMTKIERNFNELGVELDQPGVEFDSKQEYLDILDIILTDIKRNRSLVSEPLNSRILRSLDDLETVLAKRHPKFLAKNFSLICKKLF